MEDESREQLYLRLLNEEEEAFKRASEQSGKAGSAQRENLAREWFAASARLLKEHMRLIGKPDESYPSPQYPWNAIGRLANLAELFSVGQIPDPVRDVTAGGGRPNRWPGARRDIAVALDYIEHARTGALNDKAFIDSVTQAFQVDRTTVRDWDNARREIREGLPVVPADHFPEALLSAGARYHFNR